MAAKTVAEKLQIKPNTSWWSSHPEHSDRIGVLPEGVSHAAGIDQADTAVIFVGGAASAREFLDTLRDHLDKPKVLWVAYPKGNTADINRDTLWPILAEYGLRPVSQVAVDDTWSALRFRPLKPGEAQFNPGGRPEEGHMSDDQVRIEDLPVKFSNPARRALAAAGIDTPADLARHTEREVLALHVMGPKSIPALREVLATAGLSFREE